MSRNKCAKRSGASRIQIGLSIVCFGVALLLLIRAMPEKTTYAFTGGNVQTISSVPVQDSSSSSAAVSKPAQKPVASPTETTTVPKTSSQKPAVNQPNSVLGKPSISAAFINEVLAANHSPAAGKGQALYDLGVKYGIDPAFALAFFLHESSYGKAGVATSSLSLGNLRCIPTAPCTNGYAAFPTWEAGFDAWYSLIITLYIKEWGLTTVSQIIPKYAPTADNNDEAAYIASVTNAIQEYHKGVTVF